MIASSKPLRTSFVSPYARNQHAAGWRHSGTEAVARRRITQAGRARLQEGSRHGHYVSGIPSGVQRLPRVPEESFEGLEIDVVEVLHVQACLAGGVGTELSEQRVHRTPAVVDALDRHRRLARGVDSRCCATTRHSTRHPQDEASDPGHEPWTGRSWARSDHRGRRKVWSGGC